MQLTFVPCYKGYAAEQACTDGDVRFDTSQADVVQVCLGNQWGYVCARGFALDRWTRTDNNVFCQQMGLLGSSMWYTISC